MEKDGTVVILSGETASRSETVLESKRTPMGFAVVRKLLEFED
jgi:hypothetical protein